MAREVSISINGTPYALSPLTLGAYRDLTREGHLKTLDNIDLSKPGLDLEVVEALIAALSAAIIRTHPECTREWVAANVTMVELGDFYGAILALSVPPAKKDASPNAGSP